MFVKDFQQFFILMKSGNFRNNALGLSKHTEECVRGNLHFRVLWRSIVAFAIFTSNCAEEIKNFKITPGW